ncbi:MAG: hypothetical protein IH600_04180 [Bacteroidetes bacterium]|nr:hypothetical protein [Bacteroidota bacterium]
MKHRILLLLVVPLLLLASCSDDDPVGTTPDDLTDDEYAVWSATLDSLVVWEKDDVVVLQISTDSYPLHDSTTAVYLRNQLKVPDDAIQHYKERNAQPATIERKLTLDVEYVLLSAADIQDMITQGGYEEIYKRYPNSNGVTTLSRVGFSANRGTAVVYLSHTPGFLAGAGWAVLCRKVSGRWQVTASTVVWVS